MRPEGSSTPRQRPRQRPRRVPARSPSHRSRRRPCGRRAPRPTGRRRPRRRARRRTPRSRRAARCARRRAAGRCRPGRRRAAERTGVEHPGVLGDDVAHPLALVVVGQTRPSASSRCGRVESRSAVDVRAPAAAASQSRRRAPYPLSVWACVTRVSRISTCSPAPARSSGTVLDGEVAAVDEGRRALGAEHRRQLVEHAGRCADEVVLGPLAEPGLLQRGSGPDPSRSFRAVTTAHSSAADEDSPAPVGHVAVDVDLQPGQRGAGAGDRPGGTGDVGAPAVDRRRARGRGPATRTASSGTCARAGDEHAVVAPCRPRRHPMRQREGQHEAVVVVGVLADQVDPARCGPDALGLGAVRVVEASRRRSLTALVIGPPAAARPRPRAGCR